MNGEIKELADQYMADLTPTERLEFAAEVSRLIGDVFQQAAVKVEGSVNQRRLYEKFIRDQAKIDANNEEALLLLRSKYRRAGLIGI